MKATLEHLVHCCHGDDRPDCPIIDTLEAAVSVGSAPASGTRSAAAGLQPGRHLRRARS